MIHHATRAVHIAGITTNPDAAFIAQVARNLTDPKDGFLRDQKFLVLDLDTKLMKQLRRILEATGGEIVRTAFQAPNMNSFAERWVQSVKSECLSKLILFGEGHLRRCVNELVAHHHEDRPHQGLGNELIAPPPGDSADGDSMVADERLVGCFAATAVRPDGKGSR